MRFPKIVRYPVLALLSFWSLAPLVWTLITSVSKVKDLTANPPNLIPDRLNLDNYAKLFGLVRNSASLWQPMRSAVVNSLAGSIGATLVVLFISLLSGYAFARFRFPGRKIVFLISIATMVIPGYAVMIPLYQFMMKIGLLNTQTGIIIIFASMFAPISVWLMKGFVESIPYALEEAAMLEGLGRWRILFRLVLPLTAPGLVAVAILTFLGCWSQFVTNLVFTPTIKTLTVFISEFVTKVSVEYPSMCAVGIISIIPPVLIVAFLNRYLINGLVSGSVKG